MWKRQKNQILKDFSVVVRYVCTLKNYYPNSQLLISRKVSEWQAWNSKIMGKIIARNASLILIAFSKY